MQILITDSHLARSRVLQFRRWQLLIGGALVLVALMLLSGVMYHFVFMQAARERWPVVSQLVRWVVHDDLAQQERFMRENLDAMALRVGEMQARVLALQVMGDRVAAAAGLQPQDLRPATADGSAAAGPASAPAQGAPGAADPPPGRGGPYRPWARASLRESLDQLADSLARLDESAAVGTDIYTYVESRLLEGRLDALMVPSSQPVAGVVGSGFGFRYDPFNGRRALHTGLDYPAPVGTTIRAAAGGVVQSVAVHPEYGRMLVIDHGNGLLTRYAHTSRVLVAPGDLVRREQPVAEVGSTGRSTGPHLHFEVLVDGVPQNPARFLARRAGLPTAGLKPAVPQVLN